MAPSHGRQRRSRRSNTGQLQQARYLARSVARSTLRPDNRSFRMAFGLTEPISCSTTSHHWENRRILARIMGKLYYHRKLLAMVVLNDSLTKNNRPQMREATPKTLLRAWSLAVRNVQKRGVLKSSVDAGFLVPSGQKKGSVRGLQVFVVVAKYSDEVLRNDEMTGGLLYLAHRTSRAKTPKSAHKPKVPRISK